MTETVITVGQARKAVIGAQGLTGCEQSTVEGVVGRLCGVQYDPNPQVSQNHYLVLWNRVPGFVEGDLDEAAYVRFAVIEGNFMRRNLFYVPRGEFNLYRQATRSVRRWQSSAAELEEAVESDRELVALQERILECLSGEPMSRPELQLRLAGQREGEGAANVGRVLRVMLGRGEAVVCGRRSGTFRQPVYGLSSLLPVGDPGPVMDEDEARRILLGRIVRSYGITSASHLSYLTGFATRECVAMLKMMRELVTVRITGVRGTWIASPGALETGTGADRMGLLPPLDNLVRDRSFLNRVFGYSFTFEYFQKKDMRWPLSVVSGDRILGWVDCKADRRRRRFVVRDMSLTEVGAAEMTALERRLEELASYHGCRDLVREQRG